MQASDLLGMFRAPYGHQFYRRVFYETAARTSP
jgi:hypothetical protein